MTAIQNFGKKYIKNEVNFKSLDFFSEMFFWNRFPISGVKLSFNLGLVETLKCRL